MSAEQAMGQAQSRRTVAVFSILLFSILPAAWCVSIFLDLLLHGMSDLQKEISRCSADDRAEVDGPVIFLALLFVVSIMVGAAIFMNLLPRRYAGLLSFGLVFLLSSAAAVGAGKYFYHLEQEVLREGRPCLP
ncbi:hypothetical protein VB618_05500 [Microvirga sp. CF3062]|uniref:hypothetical protein n=1 Tax=Microvirga sp. CF3062 TaxID=3110182 RepID=UPI002E7A000C|nr:hypothetical protein [Microvirga sp. CF3062]MEE1655645.1 hypothetical protein [Microvirga sp. CF3062]